MKNINIVNNEKPLRYISVYDKLFKLINEGTFPEGSRLPSEPKLADIFEVSRTTLRQALALLQDDGLIKNIQGKGNYIIKTATNKKTGLETAGNPVYTCCNENITEIEMDFHIETPTAYMKQTLESSPTVIVVADRWYKSNDKIVAYTFSLIPIETISRFNIDLNSETELLKLLEHTLYDDAKNISLEIKHSTAGNFSAKKYTLSSRGHCHLLQEALYLNNTNPAIFNKHYLPLDSSTLKVNPLISRIKKL